MPHKLEPLLNPASIAMSLAWLAMPTGLSSTTFLGASGTPGQLGEVEWHIEQRPRTTSLTCWKCGSAM